MAHDGPMISMASVIQLGNGKSTKSWSTCCSTNLRNVRAGKKSNLHIPTYLHSIQIRKHGPGHLDVLLGWSCELPCENLQSKQCGRQLELALSTSANRQNLRKWKWWNMVDVYIYIIVPWCMCKYIIYILDSCNTSFVTLDLKVFLTIWLSQYVHKLSFHSQGQKAWTLLSFRAHLLPKGMGQHGSSLPAVQLAWTQDSSEIKSKVLFQKIQISLGSSTVPFSRPHGCYKRIDNKKEKKLSFSRSKSCLRAFSSKSHESICVSWIDPQMRNLRQTIL